MERPTKGAVKDDGYSFYRRDLKLGADGGERESRDTNEPIAGYWRIGAAKTKPDYPVAIAYAGNDGPVDEHIVVQIGRQRPYSGRTTEVEDFIAGGWLHCIAVTREEYNKALDTGLWNDGKPSRKMDEAERLGIDVTPGENAAPIEESLADQINNLADKARAMPEPTNQDEANKATEVVDKLRGLWKLAEAERIRQKTPHDQAAAAVQSLWLPIQEPAKKEGAALDERRKAYLRKEQARLDKEAADERKRQQAAVDAENERIRAENQKRLDEAEQQGGDAPEVPEFIPEVAAPVIEAQRAVASSSFGRASGLRKVKVAVITDKAMLLAHLSDDADLGEYLQKRADAALRGKITLPGVTVQEQLR